MAIQFHCPGCGQPIEVDDIYASKSAACPYCRRVVNVPEATAGDFAAPITARPGGDATPTEQPTSSPAYVADGGLHVGPSATPREIAARRFGNFALICAGIAVLLMFGALAYLMIQIAPEALKDPSSQPSPEQMAELMEPVLAGAVVVTCQVGMMFFSVVGVVTAIVSLNQRAARNWRAIVSLVVCGVFVLCACSGVLMTVAAGAAGAAS